MSIIQYLWVSFRILSIIQYLWVPFSIFENWKLFSIFEDHLVFLSIIQNFWLSLLIVPHNLECIIQNEGAKNCDLHHFDLISLQLQKYHMILYTHGVVIFAFAWCIGPILIWPHYLWTLFNFMLIWVDPSCPLLFAQVQIDIEYLAWCHIFKRQDMSFLSQTTSENFVVQVEFPSILIIVDLSIL